MSDAEKRSVSTDALETLGTIIDSNQKRDAIHLAVEPVVADEDLNVGEDVGLISPGVAGKCDNPLGIVDPFLRNSGVKKVKKGQHFWLVVYPRQITSLRHVWSHPSFLDEPEVAKREFTEEEELQIKHVDEKLSGDSERWLRNFCKTQDCPDYETVMEAIMSDETSDENDDYYGWSKDGGSIHFSGREAHAQIPNEFWDHVEVVTGKRFGPEKRATYFSCSC